MSKVVLIASDQTKFQVDQQVAKKSQLLKNMIEDTGCEQEIYLPNVKSQPLKKIIEYSEHYKSSEPSEIEKPLPKNSLKDLVDPWDENFINLPNQEELLELLLSANYLDIRSLIELCCAKIATMIKGNEYVLIKEKPPNKQGKPSELLTTSPQNKRPKQGRRTNGPKIVQIDLEQIEKKTQDEKYINNLWKKECFYIELFEINI